MVRQCYCRVQGHACMGHTCGHAFTLVRTHTHTHQLSPFVQTKKCTILSYPNSNPCSFLQEAECEKARMDTKYKADASVADASREFKMQKAHFDSEVNTKVISLRFTLQVLIWLCGSNMS